VVGAFKRPRGTAGLIGQSGTPMPTAILSSGRAAAAAGGKEQKFCLVRRTACRPPAVDPRFTGEQVFTGEGDSRNYRGGGGANTEPGDFVIFDELLGQLAQHQAALIRSRLGQLDADTLASIYDRLVPALQVALGLTHAIKVEQALTQ